MVQPVYLHFLVDGAGHDVTRGQAEPFVIFLHELLAVRQAQDAAVSPHGLRDEVGRVRLAGMEEGGGVELHELHALHRAFGAVDHGNAVARGDVGVGGGGIDSSCAACGHQGDFGKEGVDFLGVGVEDVSAVAFDVRRAAGHFDTQVVLGDDFHGEVVFQDGDVRVVAHGFHQSALDFKPRVVGMVQDAEFRVSAFAVQVEFPVLVLVEIHAPFQQVAYALRRVLHHLFHGGRVADVVAGDHGVADMLLEVVHLQVGDRGNASLCLGRIGLVQRGLAHQGHFAFARVGHFQCVTHAGHSGTDNQKIELAYHTVAVLMLQNYLKSRFVVPVVYD